MPFFQKSAEEIIARIHYKISELNDLEIKNHIATILEKQHNSKASENEELKKLLDSILEKENISKEEAIEIIKKFQEHKSLLQKDGKIRDFFNSNNYFIKYILSFLEKKEGKDLFYTFIHFLYQVSLIQDDEKRYDAFIAFPPPPEELHCVGGTGSRIAERSGLEIP